uniref:Leucine-rich repeat-containing N-terminal plant-type domain-containing protein n=1 Tax=Cucumis sativus TaxID=3659 RepID=A0A0A0LJQ6_CUCSA
MMCYFFLLFLFGQLSNNSVIVNSQHHDVHDHVLCDPKQSLALLEFKNAFSQMNPFRKYLCNHGQAYFRTSTWNKNTDCCSSWNGVECDDEGDGHVVGLHLGCSFLQGILHPNSTIFTLSHLKTLDLSGNDFSGSPFSPQFGMLTNLRVLDLSGSSFQGHVPLQISHLSKLVSLNLSANHLTFSNVVMNQLVHNLTNLTNFKLALTNLYDIKPTSFNNLSLSLVSLDLSLSKLSGNFPDHILSLPNLNFLKLYNNPELSGHLPMSNWSKSLQILDLSQTNFSGGIPNSTSEAKALSSLRLSNCNFNGEIPNLQSHSNAFMGQLVTNCVFNISQQISSSNYNSFTNVCSDTILPNLVHLSLEFNSFTGVIPSWIYSLPNLNHLDLSSNQFSSFMRDFRSNSLEFLDLSSNNLQGEISKSIYRQFNLTNLILDYNNLSGVLNMDMLRITSLRDLSVSNNRQLSILSTTATSSNLTLVRIEVLLAMPNLKRVGLDHNLFKQLPVPMLLPSIMETFSVSNNKVSGNVHPSICQATNLTYLDLSNNSLKNHFIGQIPRSICFAYNLQILSLANNRMIGGTIPSCLPNITSLTVLDLKGNNFSGTIPTFFSKECRLRSLELSHNQIQGELPQSLLNCENLEVLDLGYNNITGYFPWWLKAALNLQVLILRSNRFYGHINNSFHKDSFSNLRIIDLSHNYFIGPLPSNLFNNLRAIKEVEKQMPNNSFLGISYYKVSIVISIKGLEQRLLKTILSILRTIDFSSNDFSGEIPKEIGMLRSLLVGLTFLSHLNLSHNQLSGPIPKGKQFDTFWNSSYLGNLGLCGFPLTKCDTNQKDHKTQMLLDEDEEDARLEKGIWVKAVFIGGTQKSSKEPTIHKASQA